MMNSFSSLGLYSKGLIGLWTLIVLFEWTTMMVFAFGIKKRLRCFSVIIWGICYVIFQCIACHISWLNQPGRSLAIVTAFEKIPWVLPAAVLAAFTVTGAVLFYREKQWDRTHVAYNSVKEAVDLLPVGICYYDARGLVLLKNHAIEKFSGLITGKSLLNGITLENTLKSGQYANGCHMERFAGREVVLLPDDRVLAFEMTEDDLSNRYIILSDITDEYRKTELLLKKQEQMRQITHKLEQYNQNIAAIIAEKEVLSAKVKIHDELGMALLESKHYILNGGTEEERKKLTEKLRTNISCLQQDSRHQASDKYEKLIRVAENLGIQMTISGELPQETANKEIVSTAMHEFLTNTLRHAHGDRMTVSVTREQNNIRIIFTNNGLAPQGELVEKGGLKSLRTIVEKAGGEMILSAAESVVLTLILPKEEQNGQI